MPAEPLAPLQRYSADRFFLFPFHSCISYQGGEESNFLVILPRMCRHTQKQAWQIRKFIFVLAWDWLRVLSSLSAHLPVCHPTCVCLFLPSVITQSLIQSHHLTGTILGFKTASPLQDFFKYNSKHPNISRSIYDMFTNWNVQCLKIKMFSFSLSVLHFSTGK